MNRMVSLFKALSDWNRQRILAALTLQDELCACQIIELLQVSGATTSRHLAILNAAGLIHNRKEGRWVYYKLAEPQELKVLMDWMKDEFARSEDLADDRISLKKITAFAPEDICRKQRGEQCCPKQKDEDR